MRGSLTRRRASALRTTPRRAAMRVGLRPHALAHLAVQAGAATAASVARGASASTRARRSAAAGPTTVDSTCGLEAHAAKLAAAVAAARPHAAAAAHGARRRTRTRPLHWPGGRQARLRPRSVRLPAGWRRAAPAKRCHRLRQLQTPMALQTEAARACRGRCRAGTQRREAPQRPATTGTPCWSPRLPLRVAGWRRRRACSAGAAAARFAPAGRARRSQPHAGSARCRTGPEIRSTFAAHWSGPARAPGSRSAR
mmetsp:Transcript_17072/g.55685  ORF Transcript_17072/g.55685 Transcript_17072/m.55685 type:complete len:254 (-) Transcript_17072:486-1247(-)